MVCMSASKSSRTQTDKPAERVAHKSHRAAWLRAAVLGADDGIVSTASLMLGVTAAHGSSPVILTAGLAGLIAGAMSMATGEYVSVSSQRDAERADLDIEARELQSYADEELDELQDIYVRRGLTPDTARQVAEQLHSHDALAAHARDELGIDQNALANPLQAGITSAVAFAGGAALPIVAAIFYHGGAEAAAIVIVSLLALGASGAFGAYIGGGSKLVAAARVFGGGGIAMLVTALAGRLVGTVI